jgi:ATP-dependent RNA helicase DDX5/DBP2
MGNLGTGLTAISQSQWESSSLSKFEKNFYQEHPAVTAMTQQEVDAFRASKQINVMGSSVPKPVRTFEEGSFPDYILSVVEKEYGPEARPTPVQSQASRCAQPPKPAHHHCTRSRWARAASRAD